MSARGRAQYVEYVSDDDESYYEEVGWPAAKPQRARSRVRVNVTEDLAPAPIPKRKAYYHHNSYAVAPRPHDHENVIIENHLNIPQVARPRASSQGAQPQPNYLVVQQPSSHRGHSRERRRDYDYSSSSSSDGKSSRHRRHRHGSGIDAELAVKIAKMELMEAQSQKGQVDPALASKIARLEYELEREKREDRRKSQYDSETALDLARLRELEKKKALEAEEAAIRARMEDNARKEKTQREAYLLEYQEKVRREEEAEAAAIAAAEAKRLKKDAERKAEADRLLAQQKDKEAKEKAEMQRIIAAQREKERKDKEEEDERRKRILYEEELRKKKEKEKHEELRRQILQEEEEKKAKEKKKHQEEEDEFQMKVKERFMRAGEWHLLHAWNRANRTPGYSADYIEDILTAKKKERMHRSTSIRTSNSLALDIARPTYIRVKVEHLYPETLEHFALPWEYDVNDRNYLFIKEYISHELQQSLFEHTRQLRIRKEKLLITDGYTKDTITTIKPRNVFKDKDSDELYVVRKKSTSRSPARRSWMFT